MELRLREVLETRDIYAIFRDICVTGAWCRHFVQVLVVELTDARGSNELAFVLLA